MAVRGSGKYGPDVIVGSPEYWKLWRADNKERQKLAMERYRVKQKQLILAATIAKTDDIPIAQALAEVRGDLVNINTLKKVYESEGRIPQRGDLQDVQVVVDNEPPNPFITEQAARFGVTYDEAVDIMSAEENPAKWDELLEAKGKQKHG